MNASGNDPEWLIQDQTVLIMMDPKKGIIPSNYRPFPCLSTTQKLQSGIIAAKVSRHMDQYISRAQKEIGSNANYLLTEQSPKTESPEAPPCALPELITRKPMTQCHTHGY